MATLRALILAGGRGTRFWPLSRRSRPKQLLSLHQGKSLLRHTIERLQPLIPPEEVWISTTEDLVDAVREQAPEVGAQRILAEPVGRNTAPAIAWSVAEMQQAGRDDCVVVLPSDHWVADPAAFRRALEVARDAVAGSETVVTFGVPPRWAETGYGYVELEAAAAGPLQAIPALGFVEKPDLETARRFVDSGRFLWNAGIFLFRSSSLLELTRQHLPELARGIEAIAADRGRLRELYSQLPAESIDTGIMEKLEQIHCVPLDCGWSDFGSLAALQEILPAIRNERQPDGEHQSDPSRASGDVIEIDGHGNLLVADHGLVATLGVEGLVVVRTEDAVIVIPRERAQEVRRIVEELERRNSVELL